MSTVKPQQPSSKSPKPQTLKQQQQSTGSHQQTQQNTSQSTNMPSTTTTKPSTTTQSSTTSKPSTPTQSSTTSRQSTTTHSSTTNKSSTSQSASNNVEFVSAPVTLQLTSKKNKPNENAVQKFKLFNHLQTNSDFATIEKLSLDATLVHPAFLKLGLQYANGSICGSNSRCLAFLKAFQQFIRDYKLPKENKDLNKDLEAKLKPNINYLAQCRPLSVSMGNAIKEFKQRISQLRVGISEEELKKTLYEEIENFAEERIKLADQTICKYMLAHEDVVISGSSYAKSKLTNDDCILIYGYSSLVLQVIKQAHKHFKSLKVIVVDSRPKKKGKAALTELLKYGIECSYVLINAVSFVMNHVTKVILGAHALLANGYVMGSVGASQIALIAKSFNVPVVVCCETYKFCDKLQTDAFINNELGNPKDLINDDLLPTNSTLASIWTPNTVDQNINVINLMYDLTPPDFITCVVTDMGQLPCTSVPVVLRVKNRDNYNFSQQKQDLDEQTQKMSELSIKK